jgi:cytoskeleton protein RodZ
MSAQKGVSGFGDKLREARERRGLSLRQIANATKISMMTLEALERNDMKRLPGGIFTRAFVRSYALEVGLDPDQAIEEFMGQIPHDPAVAQSHPTTLQIEDHESVESDRRMASTFLRLILISVPIAVFVIYFAIHGRRTEAPAPAPAARKAAPAPEPPATEAPAAEAPAADTTAPPATPPAP